MLSSVKKKLRKTKRHHHRLFHIILTLLHSERPKLYAILAFLSAIELDITVYKVCGYTSKGTYSQTENATVTVKNLLYRDSKLFPLKEDQLTREANTSLLTMTISKKKKKKKNKQANSWRHSHTTKIYEYKIQVLDTFETCPFYIK